MSGGLLGLVSRSVRVIMATRVYVIKFSRVIMAIRVYVIRFSRVIRVIRVGY